MAPLASDVPALLVSGTLDGRTPVRNAADLARALPNARLLTVDGAQVYRSTTSGSGA